MSMLTLGKDTGQRLPRAATAPSPMRAPTHTDYADEAKRAAQRYIDLVDDNNVLRGELDQWHSRAIVAEEEIKRLKEREAELQRTIERKIEEHAAERDQTRQTIAVLQASYTNASKILLDGFAALDRLAEVKAKINMPAKEAAIVEPPADPHDELALTDGTIRKIAQAFKPAAETQ